MAGLEGFERQLEVTTMERIHAGVFATVTDTVERVTGRPARTLRRSWPTGQVRSAPAGPSGPDRQVGEDRVVVGRDDAAEHSVGELQHLAPRSDPDAGLGVDVVDR